MEFWILGIFLIFWSISDIIKDINSGWLKFINEASFYFSTRYIISFIESFNIYSIYRICLFPTIGDTIVLRIWGAFSINKSLL